MSDATHLNFEQPQPSAPKKPPRPKQQVPRLPRRPVEPDQIVKPDQRAVACVNMKLAGAPFHEIAEHLGYASPSAAEQAYVSALAGMYPVETWESLRQVEAMRAEQLFRQSLAMAQADYLVVEDEDGNEIQVPNTERRQWHEQAGKDLMMHATITGAKAPARVEVNANTQEINQMVEIILSQQRGESTAIEASIWDVADIPEGDVVEAEVVEDR